VPWGCSTSSRALTLCSAGAGSRCHRKTRRRAPTSRRGGGNLQCVSSGSRKERASSVLSSMARLLQPWTLFMVAHSGLAHVPKPTGVAMVSAGAVHMRVSNSLCRRSTLQTDSLKAELVSHRRAERRNRGRIVPASRSVYSGLHGKASAVQAYSS
jgi:hypothetical protein